MASKDKARQKLLVSDLIVHQQFKFSQELPPLLALSIIKIFYAVTLWYFQYYALLDTRHSYIFYCLWFSAWIQFYLVLHSVCYSHIILSSLHKYLLKTHKRLLLITLEITLIISCFILSLCMTEITLCHKDILFVTYYSGDYISLPVFKVMLVSNKMGPHYRYKNLVVY